MLNTITPHPCNSLVNEINSDSCVANIGSTGKSNLCVGSMDNNIAVVSPPSFSAADTFINSDLC